jgi:hypothetical protein
MADGRAVDLHALPRQDDRLAEQRQAVAALRHRHMRDQPRAWASALDGQVRRRGLEQALAHAAGVVGPDVADHLEPGRHLLQHLGHVLAETGELVVAAAAAHHLRLMGHGLAREVVRQRPAHGYLARLGQVCGRCWIGDRRLALGLVLLQVLQPQLKLSDVGVPALGRLAVVLAAQRGQLCPQVLVSSAPAFSPDRAVESSSVRRCGSSLSLAPWGGSRQ